jgi:hypothetical protein
MAIVIIDLLGDEDDGIVRVVDKATQEKPVAQRRQDVPYTQLEIVPVSEEKHERPRNRRVRKTNIQGPLSS